MTVLQSVISTSDEAKSGQWRLIAGGVLLGTIGIFVEEAGQHPWVTVWYRCVFGGLALWLWGLAIGRLGELTLTGRKALLLAIVTGVLMALNWGLFFAAISRTSIAVATVVFHIQPFWVLLYGAWVLREVVSPLQWGATVVALLGLILTTGLVQSGAPVAGMSIDYVLGLLMCLGGSLSYAAVTVLAKHAQGHLSPFALAWWQCAVGTGLFVWAPWIFGWPENSVDWAWLIGLGGIHTGLAYAIIFSGVAHVPLGRVAILQFVYPLTAIAVDWWVYEERLSIVQLLGVGLMVLALWAIKRPRQATGGIQ